MVEVSSEQHTLSLEVISALSAVLRCPSGSWRHKLDDRESGFFPVACLLHVPWLIPEGSSKEGPEAFPLWTPWLEHHFHTSNQVTAHRFWMGNLPFLCFYEAARLVIPGDVVWLVSQALHPSLIP